eukprot:170126_1
MLPKGPFQPTDFKPDIPEDTLQRLHGQSEKKKDDDLMTARDYIDKEQQEKEEYRKRRLRDEKEIEEYRQNARFAQTDYSSFDSEIIDRPIETYYCCYCGNYCLVMECRLKDCAKRKSDNSFCIDIKNQVCKFPGVIIDGELKIFERDNNKLELQYIMSCQQCSLPIAYRHCKNIKESNRIFVLFDAISNDPTCLQKKIQEYKHVIAIAKGLK